MQFVIHLGETVNVQLHFRRFCKPLLSSLRAGRKETGGKTGCQNASVPSVLDGFVVGVFFGTCPKFSECLGRSESLGLTPKELGIGFQVMLFYEADSKVSMNSLRMRSFPL